MEVIEMKQEEQKRIVVDFETWREFKIIAAKQATSMGAVLVAALKALKEKK